MEVKLKYINHLFIVLENNNLQCGAAISSSNMERTCICIRQLIIDEGIAGQSRVGVEKSTHKQRQSHILHQEAFILLFSLEAIGSEIFKGATLFSISKRFLHKLTFVLKKKIVLKAKYEY